MTGLNWGYTRDRLKGMLAKRVGVTSALLSAFVMPVGAAYIWKADFKQLVRQRPLIIESLSPSEVVEGNAFNVQPDGGSYLSLVLSYSVPQGSRVRFGDDVLVTNVQGTILSARVSRELLGHARELSVVVVDARGEQLTPAVRFVVLHCDECSVGVPTGTK